MKILSFLSVLAGFIVWQSVCVLQLIDPIYFPSPLAIIHQAWKLYTEQAEFRDHLFNSLWRLLAGQVIALPLATILALLTTLNTPFRDIISPWIGLTYPIPKLALFPFLLITLGTGDISKTAMIALGSFFLMYLSFVVGFRRVYESEQFEVVRVYNVNRIKILRHVFLKGAAPEIINGIKLGFGYGLVMMVGSEMTMSKNGLGFYMWNAWDQFRILDMYACLAWISLLGILIFHTCDWLEREALKQMAPSEAIKS